MTYKKRLVFLLVLIGILALTYTGGIIFGHDLRRERVQMFAWLDSTDAGRITRIVVSNEWEDFELTKRYDQWYVLHNGSVFPARQLRVEDFISILATRAAWPVRAASVAAHERFGLDEHASRVTVFAGNSVLLDILVGGDDPIRRETYIRKAGQNEVRSGERGIRGYVSGNITSWYNLRLIPETEGGFVGSDSVQRLLIYTDGYMQIFTRSNREWDIYGLFIEDPDFSRIENYVNIVLNTEGEDFDETVSSADPMFNHSRITLEFGLGHQVNIRLNEGDEDGRRLAHVEGREYIYSISPWASNRLFRSAADFER